MRVRAHLLKLSLLAPFLTVLGLGCGSDTSLGSGRPALDAATAPDATDANASGPPASGSGPGSGGAPYDAAGMATGGVLGGTSGSGAGGNGGPSQVGSSGTGGSPQTDRSGGGGSPQGGSSGGGSSGAGVSGSGGGTPGIDADAGGNTAGAGLGGVTLTATVTSDGSIVGVWRNQTPVSIFLYGCGDAQAWQKNGSDWGLRGGGVDCSWEGVSPEVAPGAIYPDSDAIHGIPARMLWGPGTYRLNGKYGVGCTHPELGQSKAGCTAFYEATSNEVTILPAPDAGTSDGKGGDLNTREVTLYASVTSDGHLVPVWHNQTQASIFLYGCGTTERWQWSGSDWVKRGPDEVCKWEGVSPEVQAGSTYTDTSVLAAAVPTWGNGETYRLTGRYGVGCTHPELGQSQAGCAAFYEVTSEAVSIQSSSAAGDSGAGDAD